ncbi:MAG: hypothetical protein QOC82_2285 [Frankiaceae bacterium]|jgi:hypothetical protein|nr:hypothetical protein [Frankiaceae bacterium]
MAKTSRVALVVAALLSSVLTTRSDATTRIPCGLVDAYSAGQTVVVACARVIGRSLTVSISLDGGRHFTSHTSTPVAVATDRLIDLAISPSYSTDRAVLLRFQQLGIFETTDGGTSLVAVDPQGGTAHPDHLSRVDKFATGPLSAPAVVETNSGPAVLYSGQHVPVPGSGNQDDRFFLQVGHGTGSSVLAVSQGPDATRGFVTKVSLCNEALSCPTTTAVFDKDAQPTAIAADPTATGRTVLIAESYGASSAARLWISTDAGKHFATSPRIQRLLGELDKANRVTGLTISNLVVFAGGRTWWMNAYDGNHAWALLSRDAGRSWENVALPENARTPLGHFVVDSRGRMMSSAAYFACSVDQGLHWSSAC